jgi:hypothetical protein
MTNKRLKSYAKAVALSTLIAGAASGFAFAADMPVKAPPPAKPVPFFFVNDTSVSFTWFFNATDPGVSGGSDSVPGGIFGEKNTFFRASGEIDHFDVWEYGTNLIHVEADQYSKRDPVEGTPGAQGSREFFAFSRSTIGWNELTHSTMFKNFLVNDIGFEVGGNYGSQTDFLAEETTVGVFGLNFDIAIPKPLGTLLVGIMADKEFTFNAFNGCGPAGFGVVNGPAGGFGGSGPPNFNTCASGVGSYSGDREFEWTWRLETFYNLPLGGILGSWADAAHIVNIANVIGPKGTGISRANCLAVGCFGPSGAFNNNESKTEVFEDVRLSIDTSKIFWGKPGIWDSYVGYRYWYNKFGTNHNAFLFSTIAPETSVESTAYVGTTYHFK